MSAVKPGDNVFVQFPMWRNRTIEELFFKELFQHDVKVIPIVWDVLSWLHDASNRDFSRDYAFQIMNKSHLLIVPNEKMAARLATEGKVQTPMVSIDLWDFKLDKKTIQEKKFEKKVFFVGTLDKTDFAAYTKEYPLYLIGHPRGLTEEERAQQNLHILGEKNNDVIPSMLDGGFGLVSYKSGGDKERFRGAERYGHYNNPLKLALYFASGLPVIVDSFSAHADFIRKENVGLVLDDINNLDILFNQLTEEDYEEMRDNTAKLSELIINGHFTKYALQKAVNVLEEFD